MHASTDANVVFRSTLYQMDIERVRFALSRYLRTRLRKIEDQTQFLIADEDAYRKLSDREKILLQQLAELNKSYLSEAFYEKLREDQRPMSLKADEQFKHAKPLLQVFYF
jgi:hypothetical protein